MFQTDPFSLIILLVGLSLLPFVAMIATSYLKIVVVMSLIRNALGIQSIPPNMVINALAMILTFYIMAPIMGESWGIARTELAKMSGKPLPSDQPANWNVAPLNAMPTNSPATSPVPAAQAAAPAANPALNYAQREYKEEDYGDDFFVDLDKYADDSTGGGDGK